MTATPIPPYISHDGHGDLDVSVIDMLPPGASRCAHHALYGGQRHKTRQLVRDENSEMVARPTSFIRWSRNPRRSMCRCDAGRGTAAARGLPAGAVGLRAAECRRPTRSRRWRPSPGAIQILVATTAGLRLGRRKCHGHGHRACWSDRVGHNCISYGGELAEAHISPGVRVLMASYLPREARPRL